MTTITLILNDPPYGDEKTWNALRLASALTSVKIGMKVNVFLFGDAVNVAKSGQNTPEGYYNLGKIVSDLVKKGVEFMACGACASARGLVQEDLVEGVEIGSTMLLAWWIKESNNVVSF